MTGNAVGGTLMLLGFIAVVTIVLLAFGKLFLIGLDAIITKWRRLGLVPRVVAVMMAAIATVEAQKSGMGDSNRVDRVDGGGGDFSRKEHKESVGVDGEVLKLGVEVEQRTDKTSSVQLGLETSTHLLVSVKTNDSYSYAMPENAVRYPNWWIRGGYEDVFKLDLDDWRFPLGTNLVDYLWVYTWGKVRPRLKAKEWEIAAVGAPMSAAPQVSEFWYADGTNDSKILTWYNFFLGRVSISELDGRELDFSRVECVDRVEGDELDFNTETQRHREKSSFVPQSLCASVLRNLENELHVSTRSTRLNNTVVPISAQLELFPNGDYIARSNLVERYFKRINPDDFDDDGIPDGVDENPELSDGDFFGPDNDLPEGANSNNYCWVDVVVSNANSLVTFIGDRPSNLPDPYFIAKPDVTNRVTLLIGKTYRVTSAQPIICTAKSNDDIIIDVHDSHSMTICYPVSYEIVDMARSVSRQIRMIPPSLVGTFNWNTNTCCTQVQTSPSELPKCAWDCACDGCTLGGFTFNYEGYSLNFGGIECGCTSYPGPEEDDGPYAASASVAFSKKAIIFEEAYENKPGELVPKQSTRTVLACVAHGGPNGGRARFSLDNAGKLVRVSSVEFMHEVEVPAGYKVAFNIVYEGGEASDSVDDIVARAQFIDNSDGVVNDARDSMTCVKVQTTPQVQVGDLLNRHKWGVGERVLCEWKPSGIDIDLVAKMGSFEVGDFWNGPTFRYFISPFCAANKLIIFRLGSIEYIPKTEVIAPEGLKAENAKELFFGLGYGVPGGAGFNVDVSVLPDSVSFREVTIMEEPSADSAITGYFEDLVFSNVWHHSEERGAGQWYSVTGDNFVFKDEVKMGDALILPVSSGNITWRIPVKWTGGMVTNYLPVSYEQSFDMSDIGCLRVSKFGFWVERDLYNERNISEGVMRCEELQ